MRRALWRSGREAEAVSLSVDAPELPGEGVSLQGNVTHGSSSGITRGGMARGLERDALEYWCRGGLLGAGAICLGRGSDGKYGGGNIGNSRADAAGVDSQCDFDGSLDERECVAERCFRFSDDRTIAICEGMEEFSIMTRARVGRCFLVCLVDGRLLDFFDVVLPSCARETVAGKRLDVSLW